MMADDKKICTVCKENEDKRILLHAVVEGKEDYVCVKCLPILIHG